MKARKFVSLLLIVILCLVLVAAPVFAQAGDPGIPDPAPSADFSTAIVNGIPLLFVVFGLVALMKKAGVAGIWLLVCSLSLGTMFGIGYQASQGPIIGFGGWFGAILYGLALGITASGVYEGIRSATAVPKG